jgi:hypothetical protein
MALEKSNAYGAGLALLAALGFSLKAIFVKLAYPYGVDAITLLACAWVSHCRFSCGSGWPGSVQGRT